MESKRRGVRSFTRFLNLTRINDQLSLSFSLKIFIFIEKTNDSHDIFVWKVRIDKVSTRWKWIGKDFI